jgi:hypothetical protein
VEIGEKKRADTREESKRDRKAVVYELGGMVMRRVLLYLMVV